MNQKIPFNESLSMKYNFLTTYGLSASCLLLSMFFSLSLIKNSISVDQYEKMPLSNFIFILLICVISFFTSFVILLYQKSFVLLANNHGVGFIRSINIMKKNIIHHQKFFLWSDIESIEMKKYRFFNHTYFIPEIRGKGSGLLIEISSNIGTSQYERKRFIKFIENKIEM